VVDNKSVHIRPRAARYGGKDNGIKQVADNAVGLNLEKAELGVRMNGLVIYPLARASVT
jgi:hypothetical protein